MVLVKSRPVVNQVITNLGLDMSYEEMANIISISNPSNTRILEIKADYPDAFLAKKIVDEFALVSTEQIAKIMDTDKPTIVEDGYISPFPSSPNTRKNTIIGGLIGVFIAAAVIIVVHLMDDTVKNSEDIEKYLHISTLGLIPIEPSAIKDNEINRKNHKKRRINDKKAKR
jgi:capsular polysaccharide biosynthesis protein